MPRHDVTIPAESDLLCEGCGYTLRGLPDDGNCPECGKPIDESRGAHRHPSVWDQRPGVAGFFRTSAAVLFTPTRFFRTLATRGSARTALVFARLHWVIVSLIAGVAVSAHLAIFVPSSQRLAGAIALACYITLALTTNLAAWLTNWEASYRGLRLPLPVVRRGMHYHAAHYLPVAMMVFVTVFGYRYLLWRHTLAPDSALTYLYVLCAQVIVAAAYLFHTYWIAMRNMLYANR